MLVDLLILGYIILLFPLIFECEKLPQGGFKVLLSGVFLTPVVGLLYLTYVKKKSNNKHTSHTSRI
ncbi:MAG: hypothetical protein U5L09_03830 [Bacteroidales bacterium]|nr:hypothetical protein [Bacteroidales bacterium]